MKNYQYVYLSSDKMWKFTLTDFSDYKNIKVLGKSSLSGNRVLNLLLSLYLSAKINNIIKLPFKSILYRFLFPNRRKGDKYVFIITPGWLDEELFSFLRSYYAEICIVTRFEDLVLKRLAGVKNFTIEKVKQLSDIVVCYDKNDAIRYDCQYFPVGISFIDNSLLKEKGSFDVCFIGAAKNRQNFIEEIYLKCRELNLNCYFYLTGVPQNKRNIQGICYADEPMSYCDYLSYELSSRCLLEVLQEGATGRTYRMMEAIMYKKKLVTNCAEIFDTKYANSNILFINDINDLKTEFFEKPFVDYQYSNDFSPINTIKFISKLL